MHEKNDSTNRLTVRWSEEVIRGFSTQGRIFASGERVEITKGLPPGSRLVDARLETPHPPDGPQSVLFTFESHLGVDGDEISVEMKVDYAGDHDRIRKVQDEGFLERLEGLKQLDSEMSQAEFLKWLHDRLHLVHGDSPKVDFMQRLSAMYYERSGRLVMAWERRLARRVDGVVKLNLEAAQGADVVLDQE